MTLSFISLNVPTEHAEAVRSGITDLLTGLGIDPEAYGPILAPNDSDVLAAARQALSGLGVPPEKVARIVFHTAEWDNGYFFTEEPRVEFATPDDPGTEEYQDALGEADSDEWKPVTDALHGAHGGSLGEYDEATIDLAGNRVIY